MTKVIFINRYFYPDHSATSQMLTDLAFALTESGEFEVNIVTSRQRYDDAKANLPTYEETKGVRVHRVWTSVFGRQNLAGRAFDYLSFYITAFVKLLVLADSRTIIIAKTDPPLISVVAALAAKLKSARLVNWIQDLFPEVAASLGIKFARGPVYASLKRLRNLSLRSSLANVVIGDQMKKRLMNEGVSEDQICVIHNWADGEKIYPIAPEKNALRRKWGLDGKFVVGYSGNLGRGHEFNTILDTATALRDHDEIVFLMIGAGANLELMKREAQSRELGNIVFKPYQPRERLSESLSASDLHLISLKAELEGLIVPSKYYGIAAVGRPMLFIGSSTGEIARMLHNGNCGISVAEGDVGTLKEQILEIWKNIDMRTAMGNSARNNFEIFYDRKVANDQWKNLLPTDGITLN